MIILLVTSGGTLLSLGIVAEYLGIAAKIDGLLEVGARVIVRFGPAYQPTVPKGADRRAALAANCACDVNY